MSALSDENPTQQSSPTSSAAQGTGERVRLGPAKINLYLHITGTTQWPGRGLLHTLDSVTVPLLLGDRLGVTLLDTKTGSPDQFEASGRFAIDLPPDGGSLRKAMVLAREIYGSGPLERPLFVRINKGVPAGSGFGIASAGAAALLCLLASYVNADPQHLLRDHTDRLVTELGADVPACLAMALSGGPVKATGVGEIIELQNLPGPMFATLAWPGVPLETGKVFGRLERAAASEVAPSLERGLSSEWVADLQKCRNDLSQAAAGLAPELISLFDRMTRQPGVLLVRMSGSGSGVFGLFHQAVDALAAASNLRVGRYWSQGTVISLRDPDKLLGGS